MNHNHFGGGGKDEARGDFGGGWGEDGFGGDGHEGGRGRMAAEEEVTRDTPENVQKAAGIYDLMAQNGNRSLEEIAGGRTGEKAVEFLRENEEAYHKLMDYLSGRVMDTVIKHGHELGERIVGARDAGAINKQHPFTGEYMDSWDYVAALAAAKLNGSFDYRREDKTVGKELGQHRHAANLLLEDLGNYGELKVAEAAAEQSDGAGEELELMIRGLDTIGGKMRAGFEGQDLNDEVLRGLADDAQRIMLDVSRVFREMERREEEVRKELRAAEDEWEKARRNGDDGARRGAERKMEELEDEKRDLKRKMEEGDFVDGQARRMLREIDDLRYQVAEEAKKAREERSEKRGGLPLDGVFR